MGNNFAKPALNGVIAHHVPTSRFTNDQSTKSGVILTTEQATAAHT